MSENERIAIYVSTEEAFDAVVCYLGMKYSKTWKNEDYTFSQLQRDYPSHGNGMCISFADATLMHGNVETYYALDYKVMTYKEFLQKIKDDASISEKIIEKHFNNIRRVRIRKCQNSIS
jgi:hypothetical protein